LSLKTLINRFLELILTLGLICLSSLLWLTYKFLEMSNKNLANPHPQRWGFLLGINRQIKSDRLINDSGDRFAFPLSLPPDKRIMLLKKANGDRLFRANPRILIDPLGIVNRTFRDSFTSHIFTWKSLTHSMLTRLKKMSIIPCWRAIINLINSRAKWNDSIDSLTRSNNPTNPSAKIMNCPQCQSSEIYRKSLESLNIYCDHCGHQRQTEQVKKSLATAQKRKKAIPATY